MKLPWLASLSANDHLSSVRDIPLAKLARDDMLAMILRGELAPGHRINEPDVAARLGCGSISKLRSNVYDIRISLSNAPR